jgi:hypothetical protein
MLCHDYFSRSFRIVPLPVSDFPQIQAVPDDILLVLDQLVLELLFQVDALGAGL